MATPSCLPFHDQHGVPADWNSTRLLMNTGASPLAFSTKSLAEYAAERKSVASGFGAKRGVYVGGSVVPRSLLVDQLSVTETPSFTDSESGAGGYLPSGSGRDFGGLSTGPRPSVDDGGLHGTLPKHFYIGRQLQARRTLEGSLRWQPVETPAGAEGATASRPPTAGTKIRWESLSRLHSAPGAP